MYYLLDKWNIEFNILSGNEIPELINSLISIYPDNIIKQSHKSLNSNLKRIVIVKHPLERLYNIYNNINNYSILQNFPHKTFKIFIQFLFKNHKKILNPDKTTEISNLLSLLHNQIHLLTTKNNYLDYDLIINETLTNENIKIINKFITNKSSDNNIILDNSILNNYPSDYMIEYTEELIKMVYVMYYYDFKYFDYTLYKVPPNYINYPIISKQPLITIITPTLGNRSLLRLKKSLMFEKIPYIHLILWDKNRVNNSLNPIELEDEITTCYEFKHHFYQNKNQRNDVWLRAVGISLTNTPFITFFDDDTWCNRNHLYDILDTMTNKKLDYLYCQRTMWQDINSNNTNYYNNNSNINHDYIYKGNLSEIGVDNFEAIGEKNKYGYRLIDNSSFYLRIETARQLAPLFLNNPIYGDDRLTPDFLDKINAKGERYMKPVINHIAKPSIVNFFKNNIRKL